MNQSDMVECSLKCWLDLSAYQTPGVQETDVQKPYLKQVPHEEIPAMEMKQAYVALQVNLSQPIYTKINEIFPPIEDLIF